MCHRSSPTSCSLDNNRCKRSCTQAMLHSRQIFTFDISRVAVGTRFTTHSLTCSAADKPCAVVPSPESGSCCLLADLHRPPASAACGLRVPSATLVLDQSWPLPYCSHPNQSTWSVKISNLTHKVRTVFHIHICSNSTVVYNILFY